MNLSNLPLPKSGRTRRKSYAGPGTQGPSATALYNIPDNGKAIDFHQEQKLMKEHLQMRRGSVPARTTDLSAFAMPLLESDQQQDGTMDIDSADGRPRSSSGSSGLKLFGGKSRQRNKSGDGDPGSGKNGTSPSGGGGGGGGGGGSQGAGSKVKSFFDTFRPRSKSDVSGLKKPGKKHREGLGSMAMDRSMDESTLGHQYAAGPSGAGFVAGFKPSDPISPMGQILEGQMLGLPGAGEGGDRNRHKSGGGAVGYDFMSKFRTRSNSDSRTRGSPRRPLVSQKSLSPPGSPRIGFSPMRAGSGEPRSAPPISSSRPGPFSDHTHAIIYKSDLMRLSVESDTERMEIEDLDENEDQVYSKFMRAHKCYDLIPTSAKLVIFDTQLNVKKAFFALVYNGVRAAPLWDTAQQDYVGMLTITDFINILKKYYKAPNSSPQDQSSPETARLDELEDHKIATWREVLKSERKSFVFIDPDASLYEAVKTLIDNRVHRLPVVDRATGNAIYILTHKRILRFLHIYLKDLPRPTFMTKTLKELCIGTYDKVITASATMTLIEALNLFVEHRISALPVLDDEGQLCDIYAKFDVINLAAEKTYNNLDITVAEALRHRTADDSYEGVATCHDSDTLEDVMENIVKAEVHRLVVVDENKKVKGIVSLSDLLHYIIIRPMNSEDQAAGDAPIASAAPSAPAPPSAAKAVPTRQQSVS